jgi:hypothetical protein
VDAREVVEAAWWLSLPLTKEPSRRHAPFADLATLLNCYLNWRQGRSRSPHANQLGETAQTLIDELLRDVLAGKDPSAVFRLSANKRRGAPDKLSTRAATTLEVARLVQDGVALATAKRLVAETLSKTDSAEDVDPDKIARWYRQATITSDELLEYRRVLTEAGLLD